MHLDSLRFLSLISWTGLIGMDVTQLSDICHYRQMSFLLSFEKGQGAMNEAITHFLQTKRIDSFQKLRLLLFLYAHPGSSGTNQEFAKRLYLGDVRLLEKITGDLQTVGLIEAVEGRYTLRWGPGLKSLLDDLARIFEQPLTRQKLLDRIQQKIL